jgi:outer membrane autotransporter protein
VGDASTVGVLRIMGNYTQTATGNLTVKVGGTDPSLYDQLAVSGCATLDGTLTVTLVGNYVPATGDSIAVLTSTSQSGTFSHPLGGDGPLFADTYSDTGVVLVAN